LLQGYRSSWPRQPQQPGVEPQAVGDDAFAVLADGSTAGGGEEGGSAAEECVATFHAPAQFRQLHENHTGSIPRNEVRPSKQQNGQNSRTVVE